jgi:monoamine oxidase
VRADVAVVGAGAAGMASARQLARDGLSVVVLEARDRVGGRMLSAFPAGPQWPVELGAQVVHGDRAVCWQFLDAQADHRGYGDQAPLSVRLGGNLYPGFTLVRSAGCLLWSTDQRICQASPGDVPVSAVLPGIRARFGVDDEWVRQTWGADPDQLSARGICEVLAAADSGTGEFVLQAGFGAMATEMADGLDIRLECPVDEISWSRGRVSLRSGAEVLTAAACVVTLPPPLVASGKLVITPLPAPKFVAARALRLGDGLSIAMTLSEPAPEAALIFDADGGLGFWKSAKHSPVVLGVAKDRAASRLRERLTSPASLRDVCAELVPWTRTAKVDGVTIADWGRDPWSAGAFSYPAVGQLNAAGSWAEPLEQTLFFAGEATCGSRHPASVHGAIESGQRAAREVAAVLSGDAPS